MCKYQTEHLWKKKGFPSLERILWIWNTVYQGKTNLSGIGSLKPSSVTLQSPFLHLFLCFFFLLSCCVWKTLCKSQGNNSCNLDARNTKVSSGKSKILAKLFHLATSSEGLTSHSHLLGKGCTMPAVLKMSPSVQFSSLRYRNVGCFPILQWFSYLKPNVFSETTRSFETIEVFKFSDSV